MEDYLIVLEESLKKKKNLLEEIFETNENAKGIFSFSDDDSGFENLDRYIEKKEVLTKRLEDLDSGFETIYDRVSEELKTNQDKYSDNIRRMQILVREVSAATAKVQAQETRLKAEFERFLEKKKTSIGEGRRSSKAAMVYYQNSSGTGSMGIDPVAMDSKK